LKLARTIEQILTSVQRALLGREARLERLGQETEQELLRLTLAAERRIADSLRGLLPQFDQERTEGGGARPAFRIANSAANLELAAQIYSTVQADLEPFSQEGTQAALERLTEAYGIGVESVVATQNTGGDANVSFTFTEQDALVLETALTKGYGKEQRGLGKIKEISQETANLIRDIMVRGIVERKTQTELMAEIIKPDVGLTSLEVFDSRGIKRTLSIRERAKLIAQNETAQIYQIAATEKARDVFGDDPFWYYGSVYEPKRMTDWCKKRYGRIARVSQWNDPAWVLSQFGDRRTGTGHIHVNCRQSGHAVSADWFDASDWRGLLRGGRGIVGADLRAFQNDEDRKGGGEVV
jgi:hypothetical protein